VSQVHWVTFLSATLAAIAAGTAAVAMGLEYSRSRRQHALCWTISLALFAFASAVLAIGEGIAWTEWLYRVYYITGGVLTVPWMALGAVWLFGPLRLARVGVWLTLLLTVTAVAVGLLAPIQVSGTATLPELKEALSQASLARALAIVANAGGTPVAIFLLLRASSIYRRKKVLPNKATGAMIISAGIGVAAIGGMLAAIASVRFLAPSLAIGAVLMLAGFHRWNTNPRASSKLAEVPT
jgi:hypothetical protein